MEGAQMRGIFDLLAFGCLIALFYSAWQHLVIDVVRQRMFEIRDKMLIWAHDNGRLDDPEYLEFRESVNGFIRHYQSLSLVKLLVIDRIFHITKKQPRKSKGVQSHYEKHFDEILKIAVRGLLLRSLLVVGATIVLVPFLVLILGFIWLLDNDKKFAPSHIQAKVTNIVSREIRAELQLAQAA